MYAGNTDNEWETVVFRKKREVEKEKQSVNNIINRELVAKNRNLEKDINSDPTMEAPEQKPIPRLSHEDKLILIKARTDQKLTQEGLAKKINEQVSVIKNLESGKPIENKIVLQKINRVLGIRLK